MIPDYFGAGPFYEWLASRLVAHDRDVALMDPYFRAGPVETGDAPAALERLGRTPDDVVLDDLADVVSWVRARTAARPTAILGFCAGGTWAMASARAGDVVAVSFYGFPRGIPGPGRRLRPVDQRREIDSPLLAVWGAQDDSVGAEAIAEYTGLTGDLVTTQVFPGVGHGFLRALADPTAAEGETAERAWKQALDYLDVHQRWEAAA